MENRLASLSHPRWVEAITTLIRRSGDAYFRWHDSGDIQSLEHLENMITVARNLPKVKFWLPTREYQTVEAYRQLGGRIPRNLCIRYSAHMVNGPRPLGYGLPVSTFSSTPDNVPAGAHPCPAHTQGNRCGLCRTCWNPRVQIVNIPLKCPESDLVLSIQSQYHLALFYSLPRACGFLDRYHKYFECPERWKLYMPCHLIIGSCLPVVKMGVGSMSKHKVEFDAHKVVKKETEVEFTQRDGTPVDFMAKKPVKVPVHVRFRAEDKE